MIKLFKSSFLNYILQSDSAKQRKFIMISGETLKYFLTMMHEWLNYLCEWLLIRRKTDKESNNRSLLEQLKLKT